MYLLFVDLYLLNQDSYDAINNFSQLHIFNYYELFSSMKVKVVVTARHIMGIRENIIALPGIESF